MVVTKLQTAYCKCRLENQDHIVCLPRVSCIAGVKNWKPQIPPDVEFPPNPRNRLRVIEKVPSVPTGHHSATRVIKMPKDLHYMRGPEAVHTFLLHKQFGIKAMAAGSMKYGHFEGMRQNVNRNIDERHMFAIWRLEPLWKPMTKKGLGRRMGGGKKSNVDHYMTPVKKGRIVLELGGYCEWEEVLPLLTRVADKLPFKAIPVNQKIIEEMEAEEKHREENNLNPFTFEYCLKNNFFGSHKWASPYDYIWHNKYH